MRDAAGNVVTGDNSTSVTFAKTSGAGTVTGLGATTAASGVASKAITADLAGSITIAASAAGLTTGSTTFTIDPGAPTKIVVGGSATNLASGANRVVTATIQDAAGNTVASDNTTSVTFAQTLGSGSVAGTGTATAANGVASKTLTGSLAGTVTITASAPLLTSDSLGFSVIPGAGDHLVVTSATTNLTSGSGRTLTAELRDAAGNLLTGDNSTSVTFAKTSGSGTVTGLGATTAASGVASKAITGGLAGPITITASTAGVTSATTSFTVDHSAADHLTYTSSSTNLAAGADRTLTIEVRDAAGNLVTDDNTTSVTFAKTSGAGTVTGLGAATASNGVAEVTVTGQAAGSITIGAAAAGLTADTITFSIVPATDPTQIVITSSTSDLASGATRQLTAEVRDSGNNLVATDSGRTITFAKSGGAGTVAGLGTATTSNGVAQLTVTGTLAGPITIGASAATLASGSTTFAIVPGAADRVTVTSGTGSLSSGTPRTLTAEVRDAAGNVLTGDGSTSVSFAQTNGSGTVTGLGAATASSGVASKTVTGHTVGAVTIQATAAGLTADATSFTIVPGSADHVAVTSATSNLVSGAARTLTAEIRDAADNLVTGDNSTSVAFAKTAGTGTVTGLGAATAVNGVASQSVTGQLAGSITLGATATGLGAGSSTFTVVHGAADHLAVTSSASNLSSGAARTLTAEIRDAAGNLVTADSSTSVTFAKTAGTGTATGLGATTAVSGVASKSVSGQLAGSVTITASAGSLTSDATTFTVDPGTPSALVLSGSAADLASGATRALTATVKDAAGNTVTWDNTTTVTFGQPSGTGTLAGLGTSSAMAGIATKTLTGALAGPVTVDVSAPLLSPDTISFAVTPGAGDHLTITSATTNLRLTNQRTLTAELRDAAGNLLTGDSSTSVSFAKTAGAGTVTGLGATTAASGVASKSVTALTPGPITIQATALGVTADSTSFTIDSLATVSITGGPSGLTTSAAASFPFTGSEGGLSFECKLDTGSFVACSTPATYSGLADGPHTVAIHAIADGATGPNTTQGWTVDTTSPTITIGTGPSGTIAVDTATFTFGASEPGVTFQCSLAGAAFAPCTSPQVFTTLADGPYTFEVKGTDAAGNPGATDSRSFTVAAPAPSVAITAPLNYVNTPSETIEADAADTGTGLASVTFFECSNTSSNCSTGTWNAIGVDTTSPYSGSWTPVPADGPRAIRAIASDGNGRSATDIVNVTVDQTAPATTLATPGANVRGAVALAAAATDATSGIQSVAFQVSPTTANTWTTVDSDSSSPYAGTWTTSPADDGVYDVRVFVTDRAGNTTTDILTGIRVDNTPPTASLDDPGAFRSGTITLSMTAGDGGSGVNATATHFEARKGAAAYATVPTSWTPTDGDWDVRAVVEDNAGNVTTTGVRNVVVDNTAPVTSDDAPATWSNSPVAVTLTGADPQSGIASTEYRVDGGAWTPGTSLTVPAPAATEHVYAIDYRSTNGAAVTETIRSTAVRIDTRAPAATVGNPGAIVRGTVTLTSSVTEPSPPAASGIGAVSYQSIPDAADSSVPGNWTDTVASWDTTSLADGAHKVRVKAVDNAGNGVFSAHVVTCIDNHAPATSDDAPSASRASDVLVSLIATDGTGCGGVTTEYSLDNGATWLPGTSVTVLAPADHSNDGRTRSSTARATAPGTSRARSRSRSRSTPPHRAAAVPSTRARSSTAPSR